MECLQFNGPIAIGRCCYHCGAEPIGIFKFLNCYILKLAENFNCIYVCLYIYNIVIVILVLLLVCLMCNMLYG